jgi:hypothetical protein
MPEKPLPSKNQIDRKQHAPFRSARTELHVPRMRMIILYIDCWNCTMTFPGNCDHSPLLIQYDTTRHAAPSVFATLKDDTLAPFVFASLKDDINLLYTFPHGFD